MTGPLLNFLKISKEDETRRKGMVEGIANLDDSDDNVSSSHRDVDGTLNDVIVRSESKELQDWWHTIDNKFLKPIFGGNFEKHGSEKDCQTRLRKFDDSIEMNNTQQPPIAQYFCPSDEDVN